MQCQRQSTTSQLGWRVEFISYSHPEHAALISNFDSRSPPMLQLFKAREKHYRVESCWDLTASPLSRARRHFETHPVVLSPSVDERSPDKITCHSCTFIIRATNFHRDIAWESSDVRTSGHECSSVEPYVPSYRFGWTFDADVGYLVVSLSFPYWTISVFLAALQLCRGLQRSSLRSLRRRLVASWSDLSTLKCINTFEVFVWSSPIEGILRLSSIGHTYCETSAPSTPNRLRNQRHRSPIIDFHSCVRILWSCTYTR